MDYKYSPEKYSQVSTIVYNVQNFNKIIYLVQTLGLETIA
jgi:hypothetical protein